MRGSEVGWWGIGIGMGMDWGGEREGWVGMLD